MVAGGLEDRSKDPDLKAGVRPVDPPEDRELTGVTAAADDDDSIYRGYSMMSLYQYIPVAGTFATF